LGAEVHALVVEKVAHYVSGSLRGSGTYRVMRLGSIEIGIQRRTSHVVLIKNGTLLVLLSAFNDVKSGCFGAVSTVILRGLACFRRKIGAL
jgi:hypothetical protein